MRNLGAILAAAGSSLDRLVHVTIYLRDWADFAEMNAVYVSYLNPPYPARACVEVSHIGDDAAVEVIAQVPQPAVIPPLTQGEDLGEGETYALSTTSALVRPYYPMLVRLYLPRTLPVAYNRRMTSLCSYGLVTR